jgi:hypothetical protein
MVVVAVEVRLVLVPVLVALVEVLMVLLDQQDHLHQAILAAVAVAEDIIIQMVVRVVLE